jgi:hypothetical protein
LEDVPFPLTGKFWRFSENHPKDDPYLTVLTSNHSRDSKLTDIDCSMRAVRTSELKSLTTYRAGQKTERTRFDRSSTDADSTETILKELGRKAATSGFAKPRE